MTDFCLMSLEDDPHLYYLLLQNLLKGMSFLFWYIPHTTKTFISEMKK